MPQIFIPAKQSLLAKERLAKAIANALNATEHLAKLVPVTDLIDKLILEESQHCSCNDCCNCHSCLNWVAEAFKADLECQIDELEWALQEIKEVGNQYKLKVD